MLADYSKWNNGNQTIYYYRADAAAGAVDEEDDDDDDVTCDFFSGFSLGLRRKRCSKLLQLSDNNCVTLAVELRV